MSPIVKWFVFLLFLLALPVGSLLAQEPTPTSDEAVIEINVEQAAQDMVDLTETTAEATANIATDLYNRLITAPRNQFIRILMVMGGVILLFAGWRIYEFVILLAGILIGASVGSALVADNNTVIQIAAILIGGLLGAVLAVFLYYIAVFFIGAYVGLIITGAIAVALGAETVSPLILLAGALIGGVILLALSLELLIILSALVGAQLLALGLGLGIEWVVIFVVLGILIQLVAARAFGFNIRRPPRRIYTFRRRWI